MEQWALASSQESLPRVIIDELQKSEQIHWHRIDSATKEIDNSDNPITEWEIMNALKRGKSTAPGDDGVTYDIINALAEVRGNPLYFLFIQNKWKQAVIIPIPKPDNPEVYRPISLTSCL